MRSSSPPSTVAAWLRCLRSGGEREGRGRLRRGAAPDQRRAGPGDRLVGHPEPRRRGAPDLDHLGGRRRDPLDRGARPDCRRAGLRRRARPAHRAPQRLDLPLAAGFRADRRPWRGQLHRRPPGGPRPPPRRGRDPRARGRATSWSARWRGASPTASRRRSGSPGAVPSGGDAGRGRRGADDLGRGPMVRRRVRRPPSRAGLPRRGGSHGPLDHRHRRRALHGIRRRPPAERGRGHRRGARSTATTRPR